jgi:DNA helicase-2/ATP-dependent DNA helicase PcrA
LPKRIAALTYSRQLEKKLKVDLLKIGIGEDERLYIGTLHGFCMSNIIQPFKHLVKPAIPFPIRIASDETNNPERMFAVQRAMELLGLQKCNSKNLLEYLDKFRRTGKIVSNLLDRGINWVELENKYLECLCDNAKHPPSIDFIQVENISKNLVSSFPFVREILGASFPWFCIDEYQDLGIAFHEIISNLIEKTNVKIIAIGDPNQCIYQELQQSNPEFINQLADQIKRREGSDPIHLKFSRRCPSQMLLVGESILKSSDVPKSLVEEQGKCRVFIDDKDQQKVESILQNICYREDGRKIPINRVGIVSPLRITLNALEEYLESKNWLCDLDRDPDFNKRLEVIEWLRQCMAWGIFNDSVVRFTDLISFWMQLNEPERMDSGNMDFILTKRLYCALNSAKKHVNLKDWLDDFSGILDLKVLVERLNMTRPAEADAFNRLFDAVRGSERLLKWDIKRFSGVEDRIQLTTTYGCKGLEFDALILINPENIFRSDSPTINERRISYVTVTRAKQLVFVVTSKYHSPFLTELRKVSGLEWPNKKKTS